jgi:tetratricopeptide (TPR) repeat protein
MQETLDFERVRILAARGSVEEALAALGALLESEPRHVPALLLKASLLLEGREGEQALELCERAVAEEPGSSEARNARARCLHALGRNGEACREAEEARRILDRGDNFRQAGPVYLTLVWCLREQRRFKEALAMAEEGLDRCPDAILAQWASVVEEELAEAEKEEC